jgi:hypothetical protein
VLTRLGRGECTLLLASIDLCAGAYKRGADLLREARSDFERGGYRLGLAQCDVAEAHLLHRSGNFEEARARTASAHQKMRELGNPRGEGRCERLLGMIEFDDDHFEEAREHALASAALYDRVGDPWGNCESALLLGQIALASGKPIGRDLILACQAVGVAAAEPRQHLALSLAWLAHEEEREDDAEGHINAARNAYRNPKLTGDHTQYLLARLARLTWSPAAASAIRGWRAELLAR